MNLRFELERLWTTVTSPFRCTYIANICGHATKLNGPLREHDTENIMHLPLADNGSPDYCLDCIGKMAIRCAWCGEPIEVGEPITLYTPKDGYEMPEYAVLYEQHSGACAYVGCLRWDCAITGADMCGRWYPPGRVLRFPSPIELCLSEGRAVLVDDVSRYPDSAHVMRG